MKRNVLYRRSIGISIVALCVLANTANATNLVVNGDFSSTTNGTGQIGFNTLVTGWTNGTDGGGNLGYTFVYAAGSADTTGAVGNSGNVQLWGPNNGSANGLPSSSPNGGNYIAMDGAYQTATLSQMITGLIPNQGVVVSFYFAGAQQKGFNGPTSDQLQVSLGGKTQLADVVYPTDHGFSGWELERLYFTPTTSSALLSFFAIGTPAGQPPFALLDGVSVSTPEPGTWGTMGLTCLIVLVYWKVRSLAKKTTRRTIQRYSQNG